ncbi:MAG: hypothetical protein LLG37_01735 [Spirochaetia bacterium]|nr:hypothetical protein [Spirochaetia bacterium]
MEDKPYDREMQEELLRLARVKYNSAQEKYNAIQALAKKYNMPLEKMLKNIIMEWMLESKDMNYKGAQPQIPIKQEKPAQKPQHAVPDKPQAGNQITGGRPERVQKRIDKIL